MSVEAMAGTARDRRLVAAAGAVALAAVVLAGCGTANAPGRPYARPESSHTGAPGTPRGGGTAGIGQHNATRVPGVGSTRGGAPRPGRWQGTVNQGPRRRLPATAGMRHGLRGGTPGVPAAPARRARTAAGTVSTGPTATGAAGGGFLGTTTGLWGWALGRPPAGPGAGLLAGNGGRNTKSGGSTATTRTRAGRTGGGTTGHAAGRPAPSPDETNAGHARTMGVYAPLGGHGVGQPLRTASALGHLPSWPMLEHFNGYLLTYVRLSPWVGGMGVHYGHRGPGLVVLRGAADRVVGVEQAFAPAAGWQTWFDQAKGQPAGQVYTEHLFFAPPGAVTPTMSPALPSDLVSWTAFGTVNRAKTQAYQMIGPDPTSKAIEYGPPGPGLRVLLDSARHVVGVLGLWPASSAQGWRPWFDQPQGSPVQDSKLGSVYTQHVWLVDPRSVA